ncbi:MAG: DUF3515 domain-containing protein [Actinomycetota bacterium]|nr:DUF3515 domain-containing protein [Actinomycetota bacterium]
MTVPLVVVGALLLGHTTRKTSSTPSTTAGSQILAPVSVAAPPANAGADVACTSLTGSLPITLGTLPGRPARSSWTYVAAWGDPAVVLRCGVPKPSALVAGSDAQIIVINGVSWLPVAAKKQTVWTAIDRTAYVEVTVPSSYAQPPLAPVSDAIAKVLPAVCDVNPNEPDLSKLCTRRP